MYPPSAPCIPEWHLLLLLLDHASDLHSPMAAPYTHINDHLSTGEHIGLQAVRPLTKDDPPEPRTSTDLAECDRGSLTTNEHADHTAQIELPATRSPAGDDISRESLHNTKQSQLSYAVDMPCKNNPFHRFSKYSNVLSWWVPELIASALSVASFGSIVVLLLIYDRCAVARLDMPSGLTLNGILALLATMGRVCLCVPVCSGLLQEMWLYLARESKKTTPKSRLEDLDLFVRASYGVVGSSEFLAHLSASK